MNINKFDILSPQITLYNKGLLYHSSLISVILSIITFIIISIFVIRYMLIFLKRHNEPITMSSYNCFIEDAGTYPINSSSFFHFISLNEDIHNPIDQEFDFEIFKIIGFETYINDYINDNNLYNFEHWLYGPCNNESDTVGISYLLFNFPFLYE